MPFLGQFRLCWDRSEARPLLTPYMQIVVVVWRLTCSRGVAVRRVTKRLPHGVLYSVLGAPGLHAACRQRVLAFRAIRCRDLMFVSVCLPKYRLHPDTECTKAPGVPETREHRVLGIAPSVAARNPAALAARALSGRRRTASRPPAVRRARAAGADKDVRRGFFCFL